MGCICYLKLCIYGYLPLYLSFFSFLTESLTKSSEYLMYSGREQYKIKQGNQVSQNSNKIFPITFPQDITTASSSAELRKFCLWVTLGWLWDITFHHSQALCWILILPFRQQCLLMQLNKLEIFLPHLDRCLWHTGIAEGKSFWKHALYLTFL